MNRLAPLAMKRMISRTVLVNCTASLPNRYFSAAASKTTDFGFKDVNADEKERMVKDIFSKVAHKYDVMNDFMSMGAHRLWKDELISMIGYSAAAKVDPNYLPRHLDVAGGTGDVSFRSVNEMTKYFGKAASNVIHDEWTSTLPQSDKQIVVCDINPEMLAVGKDRAISQVGKEKSKLLGFVEGNAESLPFADDSFDLYTIAFGLRNVTNKDKAIREAYRVLKKGGRMLILEFSHVKNPVIGGIYDQFSFNVIPKIGAVVANDAPSYQYLVESIRRFPKQEDLVVMMRNEGFQCVTYTDLTFGVVAIHSGFKV